MKRKGYDTMTTAKLLRNEEFQFANDMESYVKELRGLIKKNGKEEYRDEALAALKRTGVVTKNGNKKNKIVSWE